MKLTKYVTLAAVTLSLSVATVATAQTSWDMPTPYPDSIFHTENIRFFVDHIKEATDGKLKIVVHSGASLYKANEIKRAVQGGHAQIGEILLSSYANENPIYGIDSIPFFATSYTEAEKLAKAWRPIVDALLAKQGMKALYTVPWPPQGLYTNKPIESVADLKGLKLRVYNPVTSKLAELVGAQAITVQASEVVQALATGTANTNFTSGASGYDQKAWETSTYFYDLNAWIPHDLVLVNQKAFDSLDPATQDAVLKAADAAQARGSDISQKEAKWYVEQLAKNGMKVVTPSPTLSADLKKIGDRMINDWLKTAGPDGARVIDEYRN